MFRSLSHRDPIGSVPCWPEAAESIAMASAESRGIGDKAPRLNPVATGDLTRLYLLCAALS